jgi:hypothetical protein
MLSHQCADIVAFVKYEHADRGAALGGPEATDGRQTTADRDRLAQQGEAVLGSLGAPGSGHRSA